MKDLDKYRGCLIGGAAGDALGYAVEFYDEGSIFESYGESGITEYQLVDGVAQISDDTQMALFTANGLLLGTTRGMTRGIMGSYLSYVAYCYKDWLRTQTSEYPINHEELCAYTWLVNIPELVALLSETSRSKSFNVAWARFSCICQFWVRRSDSPNELEAFFNAPRKVAIFAFCASISRPSTWLRAASFSVELSFLAN